jgi:hypothetical protein
LESHERFHVNEDGLQFVFTVLGFLWINEEELGFDLTIITPTAGGTSRLNRMVRENVSLSTR